MPWEDSGFSCLRSLKWGFVDSRGSVPSRRAIGTRCPRKESSKESCFQRRTDPAAIGDGLRAAGRERRGRIRDSHASVPVRGASWILEPPFPEGGPQERSVPRQEGPEESRFHRRTDRAGLSHGLPAAGRECRGRIRDSHASAPSRRASGISRLRSWKEGHRKQVPPQGEPEGVMLPEKHGSCSH